VGQEGQPEICIGVNSTKLRKLVLSGGVQKLV